MFPLVMVACIFPVSRRLKFSRGMSVFVLVNLVSGVHSFIVESIIFVIIQLARTWVGASPARLTNSRFIV